jgi:hypothetical protein
MKEPSAKVLDQLAEATAAREAAAGAPPSAPEPRSPKQPTVLDQPGQAAGAAPAGNATAQYLLADHYMGGTSGTLWAYAGQWYGAAANQPADEAGIEQVAFASNRTDVNWDDSNTLTLLRCWKYL